MIRTNTPLQDSPETMAILGTLLDVGVTVMVGAGLSVGNPGEKFSK